MACDILAILGAGTSVEQLFSIARQQASFTQEFKPHTFEQQIMTAEANQSQNAALSRAYELETLGDTKFSNKEAVEEKRCQDKEMNIAMRFNYISNTDKRPASAKL